MALAAFDDELIRLARAAPHKVTRVATEALSTADVQLRIAAALALGRCAEAVEPDLVDQIEATLVENAAVGHDDLLRDAFATALLHVWGRSDDQTFSAEQRHASSPSATLRLAAAKSLALHTPEPLPGFLVRTVRNLSLDTEPAVRSWAEHTLSYMEE